MTDTTGAQRTNTDLHLVPTEKSVEVVNNMGTSRRRLVLLSLCLAQFLSAIDITIVATALPTIASSFSASAAQYTWVGGGYNLASTASTPLWTKLSDVMGRKAALLAANAIFLAGSLIAALSQTINMLIGGRILQGLGGGGLSILNTVIISDIFPLKDRAKYYGLSAIVWAIASGCGPILGGVFTQTIGWRWCFFINLPLDGISLILAAICLKLNATRAPIRDALRTLDWVGCITIASGAICFLFGIESGASKAHPWSSAFTLCLILSGVFLLVIFAVWEWKVAKFPMIPVHIFASRSSKAAMVVASCHMFVFIAFDFFLALYFQAVLGRRPIISGLLLFALVLPLSAFTFGTGVFVQRTGRLRPAMWFGATLMTIGTGLFINFGSRLVLWKIILYQVIAGIGAGPLFQTPLIALQSQVKQRDVAAANSAFTFIRNLITSLSVVIGGVVLQKGLSSKALTGSATGDVDSTHVSAGEDASKYASALSKMWIFYTAFCGVMLLSSLLVGKVDINGKKTSDGPVEASFSQDSSVLEKSDVTILHGPEDIEKGTTIRGGDRNS